MWWGAGRRPRSTGLSSSRGGSSSTSPSSTASRTTPPCSTASPREVAPVLGRHTGRAPGGPGSPGASDKGGGDDRGMKEKREEEKHRQIEKNGGQRERGPGGVCSHFHTFPPGLVTTVLPHPSPPPPVPLSSTLLGSQRTSGDTPPLHNPSAPPRCAMSGYRTTVFSDRLH